MYQDAFEAVCNAAKAKTDLFKKNPLGYFVSAMVAGMFIAFGAFISNAAAAPFADAQDPMQKFMNSMTFSAALSMVLMAGADLFTGNNFILSSAAFAKKMKWSDVIKIWVVCYIGNLVGSLVAAFIFQASGAASGTVGQLFAAAAEKKMTAPAINLVLKGLLCNTLVCIAVWCSIKLKSESGKLIMIMWCILTFMVCGFEHCKHDNHGCRNDEFHNRNSDDRWLYLQSGMCYNRKYDRWCCICSSAVLLDLQEERSLKTQLIKEKDTDRKQETSC